ncbi:MAG: glycogen/starch synthase [Dysgonamonadaceae bacterium]|jgi:glycosyltransferase involved in cell wall biosynthesis|nr:glycogen/starch synthase [Dysgonamonadaceae bacterium]
MAKIKRITPDYIFESSWEVCNKVGGIYTVLSTRAKTLQSLFNDKIIFIGPDLWQGASNPDFIESKTFLKEWKKKISEEEKIKVRVGRWNIPGKPLALLVDFHFYYEIKDKIYYRMWEKFGINSLLAYGDYDESCMFAYAAGKIIESLYYHLKLADKKVIAHFNEWMLGMGALYIKDHLPAVATVFTTHATSIGRSICGNNYPLYEKFNTYNGDQMARQLNMEAKHSLEKQTAFYVDCFTTVSELTAKECMQLLEKKPDIITPNGFEFNFVPERKIFDDKRKAARRSLICVAEQLIGEEIQDDACLLAISGRYEYKNKGIDVFIEAMNRIRWTHPQKQIIAYLLVPAWINGPRTDLQNRLLMKDKHEFALSNPYYTHNLYFPEQDRICGYLSHLDFLNQKSFNTKIIFVPSYLNGNDGIFNLPYYDLLIGFDLTVFPSYYEPWGYTPLESIAFAIPTITTNLAGFGLWAKEKGIASNNFESGVEVIKRTDGNYFDVAEQIKETVLKYTTEFTPEQIKQTQTAAQKLSKKASWINFIEYYLDAYDYALKRKNNY